MERLPTILVIDDDPGLLQTAKVTLESKPYQVVTARSGEEGLAKAREEKPDVIILDKSVSESNGFKALGQLRYDRELKETPVLMVTNLLDKLEMGDSYLVYQGKTVEADDYINKPIKPDELVQRVDRLLKH